MVSDDLIIAKFKSEHNSSLNLNIRTKNSVLDSPGHFPEDKNVQKPLSHNVGLYFAGLPQVLLDH